MSRVRDVASRERREKGRREVDVVIKGNRMDP